MVCNINESTKKLDQDLVDIHNGTGRVLDSIMKTSNDIDEYYPDQVQIVAELNHNILPATVNLLAPYPNPFNPSTTIEYNVPSGGMNINLSIYDIRGRLVAELVDGYHEERIEPYKVTWNGDYLSSGIYFVRLKSDLNTQVQKITLIK